jgi:hypothetical protein
MTCPGTRRSGEPCRNVLATRSGDTWEIRHHRRGYRLAAPPVWVLCEDCGLTSPPERLIPYDTAVLVA